jgi:hypothetical protein
VTTENEPRTSLLAVNPMSQGSNDLKVIEGMGAIKKKTNPIIIVGKVDCMIYIFPN